MKTTLVAAILASFHAVSAVAVQSNTVNGYSYVGCYSDSVAARTLLTSMDVPGGGNNMTIDACLAACKAKGFVLAGQEYSSECYCDNYVQNDQAPISEDKCNMKCNGNPGTICGGAAALSLWTLGSNKPTAAPVTNSQPVLPKYWSARGCFTDDVNARALTGRYFLAPQGGMTVEYCVNSCYRDGWSIAGVEYGGECYCGNTLSNNHTYSPATADCNMRCSGNSGQKCGGASRMNVYSNLDVNGHVNGGDAIFYPLPQRTGVNYTGCYFGLQGTITAQTQMAGGTLSAASCVSYCTGTGAKYAWLSNDDTCGCATGPPGASPPYDIELGYKSCNLPCSGDPQWSCGSTSGKILVYSVPS